MGSIGEQRLDDAAPCLFPQHDVALEVGRSVLAYLEVPAGILNRISIFKFKVIVCRVVDSEGPVDGLKVVYHWMCDPKLPK